jgi:hypothetical protein
MSAYPQESKRTHKCMGSGIGPKTSYVNEPRANLVRTSLSDGSSKTAGTGGLWGEFKAMRCETELKPELSGRKAGSSRVVHKHSSRYIKYRRDIKIQVLIVAGHY